VRAGARRSSAVAPVRSPTGPSAPLRLGPRFVTLNRALRVADDPDAVRAAVAGMEVFLDQLAVLLEDGTGAETWPRSEWAKVLSVLLTLIAEAPQYRHEQAPASDARRRELLPLVSGLRRRAVGLARRYLRLPCFRPLGPYVEEEIEPLLDGMDPDRAPDRFMPFRVVQVGNVVERLWSFRLRCADPYLCGADGEPGLLAEIYARKYPRFGTSGIRARWNVDFTETRAKQVVQAICAFLKGDGVPAYVGAEHLEGRRVVVGYDSRQHAGTVAEWVAEVCLGNGFLVDLANRDTPTPALVYYLTEELDPDEVAGLINCTPSHNPPEWQGIKFNPRLGYPAPTNVTDYIAAYANDLQLLDQSARVGSLAEARADGRLRGFDPISRYTTWILSAGVDDERIPIDLERIREYFKDGFVVVDEMHGAGRGYLPRLLGEIGVRHVVIHGERDPSIPGLDYANPEEPYIDALKEAVRRSGATLGIALDTDADRFGVVDRGGRYFRPNQVLPMLVRYLKVDRKLGGRVVATQTGSPLIEVLAGMIETPEEWRPDPGTLPAYVRHPFYRLLVGEPADRRYTNTFLVPVGVKYIEEIRRMDRSYRALKSLPEGWRNALLIGGEESSGLSTCGHVPDKDGIWADLLLLDMVAYYGTVHGLRSIEEIWRSTTALPGCWVSYGGLEWAGSNTGRADVDAVVEAKEGLIDHFLDGLRDEDDRPAGVPADRFAGLRIRYLGGVRYDVAELQLCDETGDCRHYLRIRSSGTEPISRIYVESSSPEVARRLREEALRVLERRCVREVWRAGSEWRLAEVLAYTSLSDGLLQAVRQRVRGVDGLTLEGIADKLERLRPTLERRSQRTATAWLEALRRAGATVDEGGGGPHEPAAGS
jgi:phosphomannomutase